MKCDWHSALVKMASLSPCDGTMIQSAYGNCGLRLRLECDDCAMVVNTSGNHRSARPATGNNP